MIRSLPVLALLLVCCDLSAEALYARPAAGGEYGAEDGSSVANAFDGSSDIAYGAGAGAVSAGDTLYLCGGQWDETLSAGGSGSAGNYITITTDNAACSTAGVAYFDRGTIADINEAGVSTNGKSYLLITGLTFQNCAAGVYVGNAAGVDSSNIVIGADGHGNSFDCDGYGGLGGGVVFDLIDTYNTVVVQYNSFTGGLYGVEALLGYSGLTSQYPYTITISNNDFSNMTKHGILFSVLAAAQATSLWTAVNITDNAFNNNAGGGIYFQTCDPDVESPTDFDGCRDPDKNGIVDSGAIFSTGNILRNTFSGNGGSGAGIDAAITVYGMNAVNISDNIINGDTAIGGAIHLQDSEAAIVEGNTITDPLGASTTDGNGISLDEWVQDSHIRGNFVSGAVAASVSPDFSGGCVVVYQSTTNSIYGNVCVDNYSGVLTSGAATESNIVANNAIVRAGHACLGAVNTVGTVQNDSASWRNNLCIYPVIGGLSSVDQATWTNNAIYSPTTDYSGQTTHASDITTDPEVVAVSGVTAESFKTRSGSPLRRAGVPISQSYTLTDYRGCRYDTPPTIGAYEVCAGDAP